MGIQIDGLNMNGELSEVIDWYSDNPITEENTQKVFDLIENFVEYFCGFNDEGSVPLKNGKTPFEVMKYIKDFYEKDKRWCDSMMERQKKIDETSSDDDEYDDSVLCEWYQRDEDFSRFPYWLIKDFFDTDLSKGGVQ